MLGRNDILVKPDFCSSNLVESKNKLCDCITPCLSSANHDFPMVSLKLNWVLKKTFFFLSVLHSLTFSCHFRNFEMSACRNMSVSIRLYCPHFSILGKFSFTHPVHAIVAIQTCVSVYFIIIYLP